MKTFELFFLLVLILPFRADSKSYSIRESTTQIAALGAYDNRGKGKRIVKTLSRASKEELEVLMEEGTG